jgi:hypothetical protein
MPCRSLQSALPSVLLLALLFPSAELHAQACVALPVERQPMAAVGEITFHPNLTLYGARGARNLGSSVALNVDLAYAAIQRDDEYPGSAGPRNAQAIGAGLVYSAFADAFPWCSFLGVRHARSSFSYHSQPDEDGPPVKVTHQNSGIMPYVGLGTGIETRMSEEVFLIPFGNARLGWVHSRFEQRCGPTDLCGYSMTEGILHLEAEAGLLLRYRRFVGGGGARRLFFASDPVMRSSAPSPSNKLLLTLSLGMAF